jgi:hypothetical protein
LISTGWRAIRRYFQLSAQRLTHLVGYGLGVSMPQGAQGVRYLVSVGDHNGCRFVVRGSIHHVGRLARNDSQSGG